MATISTEITVRTEIVNAIRAIAQSEMGFDIANGNVHEYLFEHEIQEKQLKYLRALVGGIYKTRAWGVAVSGSDAPYSSQNIWMRTYDITVEGYYPGDGDGYNELTFGIRKFISAFRSLGSCINKTVDLVTSVSSASIAELAGTDSELGRCWVATILIEAQKRNPTY